MLVSHVKMVISVEQDQREAQERQIAPKITTVLLALKLYAMTATIILRQV